MNYILFTVLAASLAWSHGEDKPGPHGGEIRMPGPLHTEVVRTKSHIHVYLLDIHFKNPKTKNSYVKASIQLNGQRMDLECKPQEVHFTCALPKDQALKGAQLELLVKRGDIRAPMPAKYELK